MSNDTPIYASELADLAAGLADRYPQDEDAARVAEYAAQVVADHAPKPGVPTYANLMRDPMVRTLGYGTHAPRLVRVLDPVIGSQGSVRIEQITGPWKGSTGQVDVSRLTSSFGFESAVERTADLAAASKRATFYAGVDMSDGGHPA